MLDRYTNTKQYIWLALWDLGTQSNAIASFIVCHFKLINYIFTYSEPLFLFLFFCLVWWSVDPYDVMWGQPCLADSAALQSCLFLDITINSIFRLKGTPQLICNVSNVIDSAWWEITLLDWKMQRSEWKGFSDESSHSYDGELSQLQYPFLAICWTDIDECLLYEATQPYLYMYLCALSAGCAILTIMSQKKITNKVRWPLFMFNREFIQMS